MSVLAPRFPRLFVSGFALVATFGFADTLHAQTVFTESEPNSVKTEADVVNGLLAGDSITGTSTGSTTTAGSVSPVSVDMFRVRTATLPLGIYRHRLDITTTGTAGHTGNIRGRTQTNGVIDATSDALFQTSITSPTRSNAWYGFGRGEEIYYRVSGLPSTTQPYVSTLTTTPIVPIDVACPFAAGPVTVTTIGQGTAADTEIYVYDANLDPVPLGHSDGTSGGFALSSVTVNLAPGTYYVAVSDFNTANDQSDLNPNDPYDDDAVLDFPNVVCSNSTATVVNVSFAVSDTALSTGTTVFKINAFDVVWARFVVAGAGSPTTPFCFGDGTATACPCGNAGASGNGCANSLNSNGAKLAATGAASVAADTLVLASTGVPNGPGLYFQGTTQPGPTPGAGVVFGDGLRCVGGTVIRLGIVTAAGNASTYPFGATPPNNVPVSLKGLVAAGNVRFYQLWYRDAAAFCTASVFNLTNGLSLTWAP